MVEAAYSFIYLATTVLNLSHVTAIPYIQTRVVAGFFCPIASCVSTRLSKRPFLLDGFRPQPHRTHKGPSFSKASIRSLSLGYSVSEFGKRGACCRTQNQSSDVIASLNAGIRDDSALAELTAFPQSGDVRIG